MHRVLVVGAVVVMLAGWLPVPANASVGSCSATMPTTVMRPGVTDVLEFHITNVSGSAIRWVQVSRPNANYVIDTLSISGWSLSSDAEGATFTDGALAQGNSLDADFWVHPEVWEGGANNWTVRVADNSSGSGAVECSGSRATSVQADISGVTPDQGISNVTVDPTSTSAIVSWQTDQPTGSAVSYGEASNYGSGGHYDLNAITDHQVVLSGLKKGTAYHFRVEGIDQNDVPVISGDNTFLTLGGAASSSSPTTVKPTVTTSAPVTVAGSVAPRGTIAIKAVPTEKVPPTVSLTTRLDRPLGVGAKLSGTAGDNVAVARVDYSLDGGKNWIIVESPAGLGTKRVNFSFAPTAEDGNYSLLVRATDTSGNMALTTPATLVIDTLPPRMGTEMVTFGGQVAVPDASGRWQAAVGVDQTITMNAVGGPVSMMVAATRDGKARASQSFYMRRDGGSGLWAGALSFAEPGLYHLGATAVDGAGTKVTRTLPDVVVASPARVVADVGGRAVSGAKVTLYYKRPGSDGWLVWDGGSYGQENPQTTRASGVFGLLAPKGMYYLKAEAPGFQTLVTREFQLDRPTPLAPVLRLNGKPKLYVGSWSMVLPWPSLARAAVDPAGSSGAGATDALVGHALPAFRLPSTAGSTMSAVDLQGKPALVTVLSTWAPSTAEQLPALQAVALHSEVSVAPLYLGEHTGKVQTSLERAGYSMTALADGSAALTDTLGVPNVPVHYVLDRHGKVTRVLRGVQPAERLLAALQALE